MVKDDTVEMVSTTTATTTATVINTETVSNEERKEYDFNSNLDDVAATADDDDDKDNAIDNMKLHSKYENSLGDLIIVLAMKRMLKTIVNLMIMIIMVWFMIEPMIPILLHYHKSTHLTQQSCCTTALVIRLENITNQSFPRCH